MLRTREPGRPGAAELIRLAATDVVFLGRAGLILALARIGGYPCVLVAQDRHGPPPGPAALRLARRGVRLAAGLALPLVSVIDTPGPELSPQAEEDGLAGEIAGCLADVVTVPVPTVSLLLGQGTGGAALAMLPADRILAAEHAWLAPLPPEGASAIVYRDARHAPELAELQGIRSADLAARGIIDVVIPEGPPGADGPSDGDGPSDAVRHPDAEGAPGVEGLSDAEGAPGVERAPDAVRHPDAERFCRDLGHALHRALEDVTNSSEGSRIARRIRRYRHLGAPPG